MCLNGNVNIRMRIMMDHLVPGVKLVPCVCYLDKYCSMFLLFRSLAAC